MSARIYLFATAAALLSSCAAPQKLLAPAADLASLVAQEPRVPDSDLERAILPQLREQPDAGTVALASGASVELGSVYEAASGRPCRRLRSGDSYAATACEFDGTWAFVPELVRGARSPQ